MDYDMARLADTEFIHFRSHGHYSSSFDFELDKSIALYPGYSI